MKRRAPPSPQVAETLIDRALECAVAPVVPAGLAARIKREVPGMAQLSPQSMPAATHTFLPQAATTGTATGPRIADRTWLQKGFPRWLTLGTGGLGAIAAGLAIIVLLRPTDQRESIVVQDTVAADAASIATPLPQPVAAMQRRTRLANGHAAPEAAHDPASIATPTAALVDTRPDPAPDPQTDPSALAIGTPPESAGDGRLEPGDPTTTAPAPGTAGQMGPTLPQGYGYSGGMGGAAIPPGAPVRMSGGPGSGTSGGRSAP